MLKEIKRSELLEDTIGILITRDVYKRQQQAGGAGDHGVRIAVKLLAQMLYHDDGDAVFVGQGFEESDVLVVGGIRIGIHDAVSYTHLYGDQVIRQIMRCVVVESKEKIRVVFIGGLEVEAEVEY